LIDEPIEIGKAQGNIAAEHKTKEVVDVFDLLDLFTTSWALFVEIAKRLCPEKNRVTFHQEIDGLTFASRVIIEKDPGVFLGDQASQELLALGDASGGNTVINEHRVDLALSDGDLAGKIDV
jgi:hypothetical protein